eukprot:4083008-Prymnesium_polylepis.1
MDTSLSQLPGDTDMIVLRTARLHRTPAAARGASGSGLRLSADSSSAKCTHHTHWAYLFASARILRFCASS